MFKTKDIISKITILIGILAISYSFFVYTTYEDIFESSEVVEGKVIDYHKNGAGLNVPIITYIVGKDTFELDSKTEIGTYPKENRVHIEYNINNPKEAVLYESYKKYGIPISIATIGIMILLFGLIMLYFSWKKRV
ncbi:MAG: DUF3592 domain-containing protein [Candidatus Kapaibacterium sp.]